MRVLHWPSLAATLVCLIGCLGDPVGPRGTLVVRRLSPLDSVLVGAPGRPLATAITFEAVDGDGRPVPGAVVVWTVAGTNGRLDEAAGATDSRGQARALWVLGTKASEGQQLTAQVAVGKHRASATVSAIAQPVEVRSIAFSAHDTTLVRLGVAVQMAVQATDPFGNKFVPSGVRYVSLDTSLCVVDSLGSVSARKRGFGRIVALAGSAADTAWVHPTQIVQKILATPDTLRFHSLGQTATLAVQLLDDRGLPVRDSLPVDSVAVDTVVKVQAGTTYTIRSLSNGMTPVILRAGPVSQTVQVVVHQRVASVKLSASHAGFDALGDTVQLTTAISDSMGAPLANQALAFSAGDTSVATVESGGLVKSKGNGSTWIRARVWNGVADSVRVGVAQQVARLVVARDSILFGALQAVVPIQATGVDRLGSPVTTAALRYATLDPSVATVDTSGNIRAIGNGVGVVRAIYSGDTTSVAVRVAQRPVRILVVADTIRFTALGDTQAIRSTAVDSLGHPVTNTPVGFRVSDTAVVHQIDSITILSRANGSTFAVITAGEVTAHIAIEVNQAPATMTAMVTYGNPVITLPVGAPLPMSCQALDRNGFAVPQDPALVGTVRGTVTGTRCGDARVQRSGYDTLLFALGSTRARVPVIVATRPDSVGFLAVAQPLTDDINIRYVGEDLGSQSTLALRPLVQDILAAYGNPTTNLGRARAIRDWVARTAIYPDTGVHPGNSTNNLSVLPAGKTWADVNAALSDSERARDVAYWADIAADGYGVLNGLLGTLDPATGLRADDGLMVHVSGAQYRMRDIESYRFFLCTYQTVLAVKLWAAADLQGLLLQVNGHDPAAVFIPELGRWVYQDPSYNNEYLLDGSGEPLSPTDLMSLSQNGMVSRAVPARISGPSYDPTVYIQDETYVSAINRRGYLIVGSRMYTYNVPNPTPWGRIVVIDVPDLANSPFSNPLAYPRVTAEEAFPILGVVLASLRTDDSVFVVQIASNYPNSQRFERRIQGGSWGAVTEGDVLPVGACRVEYRSLDPMGNISASAVLDIWGPRAEGFLQAGVQGGARAQSQFCN